MKTPPIRSRPIRAIALTTLAGLGALAATAAPIGPGDEATRHHLEHLADRGNLSLLATTWPMDSAHVSESLERLDPSVLTPDELLSVRYLQQRFATAGRDRAHAQVGTGANPLRGFGDNSREQNELRVSIARSNDLFEGRLQAGLVNGEGETAQGQLDNSYIALNWRNWQFGAGNIDRWWGPGWQSSLILSNNARPSPGLFVNRQAPKPIDLPVLRRIGPWTLTVFANQLESERYVPEAKLLGARFAAKPTSFLEIGLSRTAQWGGEGRPQSLSNLFDLLLGKDNVGDGGIDLDGSNEPGNQLGGIDWRWSMNLADQPFAFYGQIIGEDEAGGLPSRNIGLVGLETPIIAGGTHGRVYLEMADTTMSFLRNSMPNGTYNHHIYRNGYRYKGDPIGASFDNDARVVTVGGFHAFGEEQTLSWKTQYAELNRDGAAGGNVVSPAKTETTMVSATYQRRLNERMDLQLTAYHFFGDIDTAPALDRNGIQARLAFDL